jgi:hypothetical protein
LDSHPKKNQPLNSLPFSHSHNQSLTHSVSISRQEWEKRGKLALSFFFQDETFQKKTSLSKNLEKGKMRPGQEEGHQTRHFGYKLNKEERTKMKDETGGRGRCFALISKDDGAFHFSLDSPPSLETAISTQLDTLT